MLSRRDVNELINTFLPLPAFKDQNLRESEFIVHFFGPLGWQGNEEGEVEENNGERRPLSIIKSPKR